MAAVAASEVTLTRRAPVLFCLDMGWEGVWGCKLAGLAILTSSVAVTAPAPATTLSSLQSRLLHDPQPRQVGQSSISHTCAPSANIWHVQPAWWAPEQLPGTRLDFSKRTVIALGCHLPRGPMLSERQGQLACRTCRTQNSCAQRV